MVIYKALSGKGFTLLEVLVALAILSITLAAVIKSTGTQAETLSYLRAKTLAQWVAVNHMTELRLQRAWLGSGEHEGETEMGYQRWYWSMTVSTTSDPAMRKLEMRVYADEDKQNSVVQLIGFLGKPGTK
ncbi:type II secretion system minor pseudopilin GspI [Candidatus Venteria ishoeyi]|uniref:type II secretion system minor pseudopilin GspI n=1 Tax=Candidatus Venteria ishoeyi TaxID=1899563 RepID=UPI0025A5E238|nr:type II secretion system minor pseudopilin GspI [Candidatus Venteria ishoeyi]